MNGINKFQAAILIPVIAILVAPHVNGQALDEMSENLLHADLPIFGYGNDNEWPQHFIDDDSFGCASRVAFGDWAFKRGGNENEDDVTWYRFTNYGIFHCWANTYRTYDRDKLEGAEPRPSFFVLLGKTSVAGKNIELWTIQIGARPGSDYLLLSREPVEGLIEKFNVLQTACCHANFRESSTMDTLSTRYCSINSRSALVRLAHRMAQRPPLGTLTRVAANDEAKKDTRE